MPRSPPHNIGVMIDLEMLGVMNKDSVITKIAAVAFDRFSGRLPNDDFEMVINATSCIDVGLKIDGETMAWWTKQDKKTLQDHCLAAFTGGSTIQDALSKFTSWYNDIKTTYEIDELPIWGNGSSADCAWMTSAYVKCNLIPPWKHYDERDVRTLVDTVHLLYGIDYRKETINKGTKHDPLHDCYFQVEYLVKCMSHFRNLEKI